MLRWWEVENEWVKRKGSPLESELNPYPPLVGALFLLWAAAYILPHRPGRPGTAPSCWLAPTPVCKPAALGGLLCLLPHSRVPRVSCIDSNQHCYTTELFILYAADSVKRNNLYSLYLAPSLPFPWGWGLAWFVTDGSISGSWHSFTNTMSLPAQSFSWGCPTEGTQPFLKIRVAVPSLNRTEFTMWGFQVNISCWAL